MILNSLKGSLLILALVVVIPSCKSSGNVNFSDLLVSTTEGSNINFKNINPDDHLVFLFLSPECPFCINYTKTISELVKDTLFNDIYFYAVYSGSDFTNRDILKFNNDYNFEITSIMDTDKKITHLLKATVTPQAIILNGNGDVLYSGAIDNWAFDTGRKRQVISEHYLKDALMNIIDGKRPVVAFTKPVGCYIEL